MIRERLVTDQSPVPHLRPGERVRITEGCFTGVEAIFVANGGSDRVTILMNILHREQTLTLPVGAVRKCGNLQVTFGALNATYTAVATRGREIATLRAIGFRRVPVLGSVVIETMLLATFGGAIGGQLPG